MRSFFTRFLPMALFSGVLLAVIGTAQEPPATAEPATEAEPAEPRTVDPPAVKTNEDGLVRISKQDKVWVDPKNKRVIVEGEIALTKGQLEMFACIKGTKEHESVVAVDSRAFVVHSALLAVGARSGHPVKFDPIYQVATGDVIEVEVVWTDKEGKEHKVRGQELVRNIKTDKPLRHDWVFGGSGFWVDEDDKQHYLAEGGELICVSNFSTATMDLQIRSSQVNDSLLYEAYTKMIPPRGTKVKLILTPKKKAEKEGSEEEAPADEAPETESDTKEVGEK